MSAFRARLSAHGYRVAEEAHDKHMLLLELAALVEGGDVPLAAEIREEPELRLASLIRQLHQDEVAQGIEAMARAVGEWLSAQGREAAGPATAVFRSGDQEHWHLVEAGCPVDASVEGDERIAVRVYPSGAAATYDYCGDFAQLHTIAQRFIATVLGQGRRPSQPIRIAYLAGDRARLIWPLA